MDVGRIVSVMGGSEKKLSAVGLGVANVEADEDGIIPDDGLVSLLSAECSPAYWMG